ncbi:amino acid-binding protein [Pararhodospirillum oryzae]|uniref:Amino acid-binding protein n=1 Tax=Pararhodospirillum oryzae TaxID=478448 RepID=A0A512HBH7_9PROT|nr:amino acid-binding protein [Pararhodospirillum oryzae]
MAAVAGRLFDLGADLADTSFATLGQGAEFTIVCDLPDSVGAGIVRAELQALPGLAETSVWVGPFLLPEDSSEAQRVTHRVTVSGGDRPGLLARLAEVFIEYDASIVRLDSHRLREPARTRYVVHFDVNLARARETPCLATIKNTAEDLGVACSIETV